MSLNEDRVLRIAHLLDEDFRALFLVAVKQAAERERFRRAMEEDPTVGEGLPPQWRGPGR